MSDLRLLARDLFVRDRLDVAEFSLEPGQCVVLCGPNGSGKSTLLRTLCGLLVPERGSVSLDGRPLDQLRRMDLAERIAWLPQRPTFGEPLSCEAIVAAARYRFGESEGRSLERARDILRDHGLQSLMGRLSSQVSGGELQRVLIASLIAQEVPYLLVDEPANHLDPAHQIATYKHLGRLFSEGKGVVIVSHDVRLARLLGPGGKVHVVGMKEGRLLMQTTLADPQLPAKLQQVYGVPFVPEELPGGLAVDLQAVRDSERRPDE